MNFPNVSPGNHFPGQMHRPHIYMFASDTHAGRAGPAGQELSLSARRRRVQLLEEVVRGQEQRESGASVHEAPDEPSEERGRPLGAEQLDKAVERAAVVEHLGVGAGDLQPRLDHVDGIGRRGRERGDADVTR